MIWDVLFYIWMVVRLILAISGLLLFVLAIASLFGWDLIHYQGEGVAWYWLLGTSLLLGFIGMLGDSSL